MKVLVSACLLGVNCTYRGDSNYREDIEQLKHIVCLVPVCPEVLGGLSTPRKPAERRGNTVVDSSEKDVTDAFLRGATEALYLAKLFDCQYAILKERSPSCGKGSIYDGSFGHTLTVGDGVTTKLLEENGIKVFGESQVKELMEEINRENI